MIIKIACDENCPAEKVHEFCQYIADFNFMFGKESKILKSLQQDMDDKYKTSFEKTCTQLAPDRRRDITSKLHFAWYRFKETRGIAGNITISLPDVCHEVSLENKTTGDTFYIFTNAKENKIMTM